MRKALLGYLLVLMLSFCLSTQANAETIVLLSGQKIVGKILERTELRVMLDVKGVPETFFLAEIATIDGKNVEMPQEIAVDDALTETKKVVAATPPTEEQSALESFMNKRSAIVAPVNNTVDHPSAAVTTSAQIQPANTQDTDKMDTIVHGLHEMMGKIENTNKNVVPTPDGGIIVVGPQKIIKYDKDLNEIKEISLNPDSPAISK